MRFKQKQFLQLRKTTNCMRTNCATKCYIILTVFIIRKKMFIGIFTIYTTSLNETKTTNIVKLKFTLKFSIDQKKII